MMQASSRSIFTGLISQLHVRRSDGTPVAVIQHGLQTTLDFAPGATEEEKQILRLLTAALL